MNLLPGKSSKTRLEVMNIQTPTYQPGDKVWVASNSSQDAPGCDACSNRRWFQLDNGKEYECPACHGQATHQEFFTNAFSFKVYAVSLSMTLNSPGKTFIWYETPDDGQTSGQGYSENEVFATKEDAIAEAVRSGKFDRKHLERSVTPDEEDPQEALEKAATRAFLLQFGTEESYRTPLGQQAASGVLPENVDRADYSVQCLVRLAQRLNGLPEAF